MISALREVQIPLLGALLVLACSAKALRAARFRSIDEGLGPTTMFPLHLRRPAAMVMCAAELSLGLALFATAGHLVPWTGAATLARLGTTLLFTTATAALIELRAHRPDVGCGCFGELSSTPVSLRTIARSALFTIAAAATIGVPPIGFNANGAIPGAMHGTLEARVLVCLLVAEVAAICALSPEFGEALVRLGYREPCELRRLPPQRTLAALRSSRAWRRHEPMLTSSEPADMWRELCWRYVVFAGHANGRETEVVFAVYTRRWGPPIRVAVIDALTGEVLDSAGRPVPGRDPVSEPPMAQDSDQIPEPIRSR
jgi:Methylamine utilisation protein MauE